MADLILTARRGPFYEITLNNPSEGNAATDPMVLELTRVLNDAPDDADAIVLRAAGDDFCTGRSPKDRFPMPPDARGFRGASDVVFDCYEAFRRTRLPIVGVVRGRALGFGCALAALCDITIAAGSATFQVPELIHQARFPTMVMSALIDRVPRKALTYLVWSAAPIAAERALMWGLVSEVAPDAELEATVERLLGTIQKAPLPGVRGVKEFARVAFDLPVPGAVDFARNLHATLNTSPEMKLRSS